MSGDDGQRWATTIGGDPANQKPPYAVGYDTPEEAARECGCYARQRGDSP